MIVSPFWISPQKIRESVSKPPSPSTTVPLNPEAQAERQRIEDALSKANGQKTEAAKLLGISRVTLWKKINRLGIHTSR